MQQLEFGLRQQKKKNWPTTFVIVEPKQKYELHLFTQKISRFFQIQTLDLLKFQKSTEITFMHNLLDLSNFSKLLIGLHCHRILQT